MPCIDEGPTMDWSDKKRDDKLKGDFTELYDAYDDLGVELRHREAMLCALLNCFHDMVFQNETEFENYINMATQRGKCDDILGWYKQHQKKDERRLREALDSFMSQFSDDERRIIVDTMKSMA